jgi:SAM-dependent methyltransferase
VGETVEPVLAYDVRDSGWTGELTHFHEGSAGDDHFIDVVSREYALDQLRPVAAVREPVILDIGCSSGFLVRSLRERFPAAIVVGADYVVEPLRRLAAVEPGVPLLQFDLTTCPLPDGSVDAITLLNVLEHIADDGAAARQLYRILKPGGIAVVEVPAGPGLYDFYDAELMHCRRYAMRQLTALLRGAGFRVVGRTHLGTALYPAFWATKKWRRRFPPNHDAKRATLQSAIAGTRRLGSLLQPVLVAEAAVRRRVYLPVGIRCVVTVTK